ncbi:hypothetical protein MXD81_00945 [Microbacteriaceae bacterium K1510]|nr:hypothetical protein [Microbacteriaceae bacterium K1510]
MACGGTASRDDIYDDRRALERARRSDRCRLSKVMTLSLKQPMTDCESHAFATRAINRTRGVEEDRVRTQQQVTS